MKNILTGVSSLLFYYLTFHLMYMWEYNEKYAVVQNALLYVLPALPGAALAVFLTRNSLKEFFKSWGVCILSSVCLLFIWNILQVDLKIHTSLTGFEEFGLGEGLLMAIMSFSYVISCTVGCIIAGVASFYKQGKEN